jgi:feruloyl-CoA synthase
VQDVVITGIDRGEVGALIFPRVDACRALAALEPSAPLEAVLNAAPVREFFQGLVDALHAGGTGSATRVARAVVLVEPPSIDRGEVTDKGSINQRAVLAQRAALVEAMYTASGAGVIVPRS